VSGDAPVDRSGLWPLLLSKFFSCQHARCISGGKTDGGITYYYSFFCISLNIFKAGPVEARISPGHFRFFKSAKIEPQEMGHPTMAIH
jgi:hypothetical protein